jgi:hypothetical protein
LVDNSFDGVNFDQPVRPGEEWARVHQLEIFRAARHYLNVGWAFGTSEYRNDTNGLVVL